MTEERPFALPEGRVAAAAIDAAVVGACLAALVAAANPYAGPPPPWTLAAAAVLAAAALVEILTGATAGKRLLGLAVRGPDGASAAPWRTAVRGTVRLLPAAVAVAGLSVPD